MVFSKVEPEEQEKMQEGLEYIKLIPGTSQSTVIYYDLTSQREETIAGNVSPKLIELMNSGWSLVDSGKGGQYLVREQPKPEAAEAAVADPRNPPEELKMIVSPFDQHRMKPGVDYVYVVWFRDAGRARINYFNTDESRTEHRDVSVYGDIENEMIQLGYYVVDSGGGREGVTGHYARYRTT